MKQLELIHTAIDECRLNMDEIKKKISVRDLDGDVMTAIKKQATLRAEHRVYEKFYNDVVNAVESP